MGPLPVNPIRFLVRLALVSVVVLWLAKQFATDAITLLLPAMRAEITALDDNLSIDSLQVAREGEGETVRLRANTLRPIYFGKFIVYPLGVRPNTNGWYQVHASLRGALLSPVILLIAILSWPQRSLREIVLRIALGLPLIAIMFSLDAPLDLLGNFQAVVLHTADPNTTPLLFDWDKFLEGGGSAAIALAFAVIAISLASRGAECGVNSAVPASDPSHPKLP